MALEIDVEDVLHLSLDSVKLNIKELTGTQYFIEISRHATTAQLKSKIAEERGIPTFIQRLIYHGKELIDCHCLSNYNIQNGLTVHLVKRKSANPVSASMSASQLRSDFNNGTSVHSATSLPFEPANVSNIMQSRADTAALSTDNDELTTDTDAIGVVTTNGDENVPLIGDANDDTNVRMIDIMDVARSCKLIKLFGVIDCILMILFAFWGNLLFLAGIPLAVCGYLGAKNLKRLLLVIYAIFVILSIAFRIYLCYFYPTWLMITLTVISVMLECYVFQQTLIVIRVIPHLNANDARLLIQMSDIFF